MTTLEKIVNVLEHKTCSTCKHYLEFVEACNNTTEFMQEEDTCEKWEERRD